MDINDLPTEIFAFIFKHVVISERQSSFCVEFSGTATVDTRSLIAISHVCSRWRDIALSLPFLWSRVDTANEYKLDAFQERSRGTPLSLIVNASYVRLNPVHRCRDLLVACSSRLRRLDLALGGKTYQSIDELLRFEAPALECLVVSHRHMWYGEPSFSDNPRGMNRLRALAFTPLTSWMPRTPLPALTHIYLSVKSSVVYFSSQRLVTLLCGTPALEHLHLSHLPDTFRALPLWGLGVPLVQLKSLSLTDRCELLSAMNIIALLSIPETVLIRLDCYAGYSAIHTVLPPVPYLNSVDGPTRLDIGSRFQMLHFLAEGGQAAAGVWLQAYHDDDAYYNGGTIRRNWDHLLNSFATTYSYPNVLQCRFYVGSDSSKGFTDLISCLPRLAELDLFLYLNSDALRYGGAAIDALSRICRALSDESRGLCPQLHTLRVQIISATPTSPAYIGDLKRMLRARTSFGHPIRRFAVQVIDVTSIDKSELDTRRSTTVQRRSGGDAEPGTSTHSEHNMSTVYARHLAPLVDEFQFYAPEDRPFPPRTSEQWRVPGSEDYWSLLEHDRPVSTFPWVY
ncbi:hypothetical protein K466DRAFT_666589 [Polyporus arcularius HHB13444]|uniref:F-box domain-containing protein n=1 Tax=Polyporus arcularius HHB13444 TaxID=1314778 RepID=A0A5C3P928_9APHY|nr:hypothetical protein K466DRAFT_666589 [Polyporus arcularius HHB13444]